MAAINLQWFDGFEQWRGVQEFANYSTNSTIRWLATGTTGTTSTGNARAAFVTGGRRGGGQALLLSVVPGDVLGIFDAKVRASFSTGAQTAVSDGAQLCVGFNAYFGMTGGGVVPNTGGPTGTGGYCRIFGYSTSNDPGSVSGAIQNQRVTFYYDVGSNSFAAALGTGTPPGGTGTPIVPFATGQPSRNPYGQWTYFEVRVYRSSTSGQVDLWVEKADGTMEHVIAGTALDTSVATRGAINTFYIAAGFFSQTVWFPIAYDDFWLAYGASGGGGAPAAVIGAPSYVITLTPTAESTQSGAVWTASVGSTFTCVDELPTDLTDFITSPITLTGATSTGSAILFTQSTMPYTPNSVYAIMAMNDVIKTNNSGSTARCWGRIRKGATDYDGFQWTPVFVSGAIAGSGAILETWAGSQILETDPDTSAAWVPATANAVTFGVGCCGSLTTTGTNSNINVYGSYLFMLASIAVASSSGVPGGPASGLGQPFWLIAG